MAAPSTFKQMMLLQSDLRKLIAENARLRENLDFMKGFTVQQCLDIACITLNDEFGFGSERNERFALAFMETFETFAQLWIDDSKDDKECVYGQEKLDRALRRACGDRIKPFRERYKDENLYRRHGDKVRKRQDAKQNGHAD